MDYSLLLGFHFKNQPTPEPSLASLPVLSPTPSRASTPVATPLTQSLSIDNNNSYNTNSSMVLSDLEAELATLRTVGIDSADGEELYFLGIIDILQKYNCNKKMERCFKITCMRADKVIRS